MANQSEDSKLALVSGGTRGIGAAICQRLAASGYRVATNCRDQEKGKQWQTEMTEAGYTIGVYQADISDYDECQRLIEQVKETHGPIDILINNAGITQDTTLRKMTPEQWQSVMRINLDGMFNMTRPIINDMLERKSGRIVNVSSINGQRGQVGQTNYATTKAGIHGFTMSLAREVARKGITVNTISPGYIATDMVMAVPEDVRDKIIAEIPAGRLGKPEEVASMVNYLVSDEAEFITGADIAINGGQHMY